MDAKTIAKYPSSSGYVPEQKPVHLSFTVDGSKEPTGFELVRSGFGTGSYGYGYNGRVVIDGMAYQFSLSITKIDSGLEPFAAERAKSVADGRAAKAKANADKAAARKAKANAK